MNVVKKVGRWIIYAALCVLAVEIVGAAMFYRDAGSLVYFNRPQATADATPAEPPAAPVYKQHLHPYFGYTGPYAVRGFTNNLGFPDSQERFTGVPPRRVPFKPNPNDFVVFVFGGSVAERLVNRSQQGTTLQEALQGIPQLAGKNVVIYNMAQDPGKQPQQLAELGFLIALGQHIDLVLNLDGTPEFVYAINNSQFGVDPIFPPVDIFVALSNGLASTDASSEKYYELAYGVAHARTQSKRYASPVRDSRTGIIYLKNRIFKAVYDRSLEEKLRAYNQTIVKTTAWESMRKLMSLDMPTRTSKENIMEDAFKTWLRSSDLMKAMANSTGAAYLNIVHPNPYHSKKIFTAFEKAAFNLPESSSIPYGSAAGLALIESRAEMLKSRGIVSGITLFDGVSDTIYIDGTGHLGKLGESMLADFVAAQVALRLRSPQVR